MFVGKVEGGGAVDTVHPAFFLHELRTIHFFMIVLVIHLGANIDIGFNIAGVCLSENATAQGGAGQQECCFYEDCLVIKVSRGKAVT